MFLKAICRFSKIIFFAVTVAAVTAGCVSYSGRYAFERSLKAPEPFPFRFYLCSINVFSIHRNGKMDTHPSQAAGDKKITVEIRAGLLKSYPQYFTDKPENALPIDIELIRLWKENRIDGGDLTCLLSLFTIGLIPWIKTYDAKFNVVIKYGNIKAQEAFRVFRKTSWSVGVVGAILQTHKWVKIDKCDFYGTDPNNNFLIHPNSERFLLFFPSIINRLDRNALITYFNSQIRDSITLLE